MVKDRLQDLHKTRPSLRSPTELNVSGLLSNNLQILNNEHFLQQISQMHQFLYEIDVFIRQMLQVQEIILCRTVPEPEDKNKLDLIINQIRKLIGELRNNLHTLEIEQKQTINLISNATKRININQIEQLKRRLCQVLETFQLARESYRQRVTKRVKRQLELAGEPLNQQDIEHLLEEKSEQIFYRNINPINVATHLALEEVTDRHSELIKLEKSIGELTDCFGDMLALVNSQNSIVNRVDKNIQSALEYTNEAKRQINKAVIYKKSSNRLKCAIILLIGGILLILILLLIISFKLFLPNNNTH